MPVISPARHPPIQRHPPIARKMKKCHRQRRHPPQRIQRLHIPNPLPHTSARQSLRRYALSPTTNKLVGFQKICFDDCSRTGCKNFPAPARSENLHPIPNPHPQKSSQIPDALTSGLPSNLLLIISLAILPVLAIFKKIRAFAHLYTVHEILHRPTAIHP